MCCIRFGTLFTPIESTSRTFLTMKILSSAIAILALSCSSAAANWSSQNSGEDVFGNSNVTVTGFGDNSSLLRFECGSNGDPKLAFLIRIGRETEVDTAIGEMIGRIGDDDRLMKATAFLTEWNDKYAAMIVTDQDFLRALAQHMITASKPFSIGIEIAERDFRMADTFTSRGSTEAGNTAMKGCFPN